MTLSERVAATLATIPDFPKPGIQFKDIAPVLADPALLDDIIQWVCRPSLEVPNTVEGNTDLVVALDARGFLFGVPVALAFQKPFVMCRKFGKLPGPCASFGYKLEYGTATVEIQVGAIQKGQKVLLIDDLLATGGTAHAACELIRKQGGIVTEAVFITELDFLEGRKRLEDLGIPVRSLVHI
jgi:adenine phosphoribosyltransferase